MSKSISKRQHTVKLERSNISEEIQPHTAAGEAFSELVVQIFRLNGLLLAAGDALAEPAGQTSARWRILAAIENKSMTVVQIANAWGLARQSVQRVADILVQEGFAVYMQNPRHRRSQLLTLTPEGRTALQRIQAAQQTWANSLGDMIGETDLRQANTILSRVLEVVAKG
jgi:DNA-binding MarR family transcriptional regulator